MLGDETELLKALLHGMPPDDVDEAVRAMNAAPPAKPNGRRRRRNGRPPVRQVRRAAGPSAPG